MACAIRGLCSWKVFLVVLVVVACNSVAAAAPYQVCFNKINSSPQAPPPPLSPRLRCLRFHLVAPDLAGFEVDLRAVPSDPPPGSLDLLPGVVPHLLNLVLPATIVPPRPHVQAAYTASDPWTPTHDSTGSKPEEPASTWDSIPSTFYRRRREASTSVGRSVRASSATRSAPLQPTQARGISTLLFSPLAISQLTAGVFFTGSISVVSMWFWSKDLFVIQTSLKVRFVIWLLNI
jgi:hypothetical protein